MGTIGRIAIFGGVAGLGIYIANMVKQQSNMKKTPFYQSVVKSLREHRGAVSLMGEPILGGNITLVEAKIIKELSVVQFKINVKGPKDKGAVYFSVSGDGTKMETAVVGKIELELKSDNTRRLIIKRDAEEEVLREE